MRFSGCAALGMGLLLAFAPGCNEKKGEPTTAAVPGPNEKGKEAAAPGKAKDSPAAEKSPREVFEAMVAVYREAKSYEDNAVLEFDAKISGNKAEERLPFFVVFARPNMANLGYIASTILVDGAEYQAFSNEAPNQYLKRPAPAELSVATLFDEPLLKILRRQSQVGDLPQLILLTSKDPMASLLNQGKDLKLLPPAKIKENACWRVSATRPDGLVVFWIDQASYVLRRVEYPIDALREGYAQQGKVEEMRLVAEIADVKLNGQIDPKSFRRPSTQGFTQVKQFDPPHMAKLLGKKSPAFQFTGVDEKDKPITPADLEGKVVLLDFWATWCGSCRNTLPEMQKAYEKFKNNPKVAFLAVSIDDAGTQGKALADFMKDLKVTIPVARDTTAQHGRLFQTFAAPARVLIGPDGIVQDFEMGGSADMAERVTKQIEDVLAGKKIYEEKLAEFEEIKRNMDELGKQPAPVESVGRVLDFVQREIPKTEIVAAFAPKNIKLVPRWKCDKLKDPGNILVVAEKDKSRVFVLDGLRNVAELAPDGSVAATHELKIPDKEVVGFLRTNVGRDGKRLFAGSFRGLQQVHVFDDAWNTVLDFPKDALESPHAGIGSVLLDDLDGSGQLKLYVGYLGQVGVHEAGLDGKRIWSNRSLDTVLGLAAVQEGSGRRLLATYRNQIIVLDAKGERTGEVTVGRRPLEHLAVSEPDASQRRNLAGLAAIDFGAYAVVGIDPARGETWSYELPKGINERPVESIVPGRLGAETIWLVPAADGSIHLLDAGGRLIDRFSLGAATSGLATVEVDGKPVLIVADARGVEAFNVEK